MLKRARPNTWVKIGTSLLALGFALTPMRPSLASSITFTPIADSYVNERYPNNNYASAASLRTDASPAVYRSFVRFAVNGVGAAITRATLRLYANSANGTGFTALAGTDNSWNEKTITYANQPALGVSLGVSPPYAAATWSAVDVTPQVRGNGTFTFELVTTSSTMTNFASRESGAHAPQLVVETANTITSIPVPAPSPTIAAPPPPPPPSLPSPPQPTQTSGDFQPAFPIRAAFYYPWFPEAWTQLGIYPYTNYNPSLGFYNGADPAVIAKQIAAMRYGGIQAGIASWWGQGTHTDRKIATLLQAAAGTPFRWSIYYENESLGNPSVSQINADLTYIRDHYGKDRSFLRVGGKFVVFVYSDGVDGCGMADRWRQANTVGAYIVLKVFPGYQLCGSQPQGWHQYSPAVAESNQAPYSYSIAPGFYKTREAVRLARNLSTFTQSVRNMVASRAAFHLVTTFNEWGEGTSVESAREWASSSGYGTYLDALHAYGGSVVAAPAPAPAPTSTQTIQTAPPPPSSGDPVIAAAGDIACDPASGLFNGGNGTATNCRQRATSDLLLGTGLAGVLTLGDTQYENGSLSNFQSSFAPSWGRVKSLIHPAVGNHEYLTSGASGYYSYFGSAAGDPSKGYYSYNIGAWHLIALNSNCSSAGGCGTGSAQEQWLKADLAAHPAACTLAYWHHPRFSSGQHGNNTAYDAFWRDLYAARADLVLVGHDHDYERFAPQDPSERADANGIRQFVVGTGGKNHYGFSSTQPTSEVRNDNTYGVLRLTLHPNSYDWRFVPEPGKTFSDAGTGSCH